MDQNQVEEGQPSAESETIDSEAEVSQEDSETNREEPADSDEDVEGGAAE